MFIDADVYNAASNSTVSLEDFRRKMLSNPLLYTFPLFVYIVLLVWNPTFLTSATIAGCLVFFSAPQVWVLLFGERVFGVDFYRRHAITILNVAIGTILFCIGTMPYLIITF